MHQPIVPFQARGNWCVLIKPEQRAQREELLNLAGRTSGDRALRPRPSLRPHGAQHRPRTVHATGPEQHSLAAKRRNRSKCWQGSTPTGPNLTELEPSFQPNSKEERHKIFAAEKPHLTKFEYANTAGYAVLRVAGMQVTADVYNGTSPHSRGRRSI